LKRIKLLKIKQINVIPNKLKTQIMAKAAISKPAALSADLKGRIEALNVDAGATTETAKANVLLFLQNNDVDGVEEYELKDLVEMAELFEPQEGGEEVEEGEEEVYEQGDDEPEEEVEEEEAVEDEVEVEETDYDDLETAAGNLPSKKIVPAVKKPVAVSKPTAPAAAPKSPVKPASGGAKTGVGRKPTLEGEKWNGRENEDHMLMLGNFAEIFPDDQFEITVLKQGFTVRLLGKNTKPTILNFDELRVTADGLVGNLYANRFSKPEELTEILPEAYQDKQIGIFRGESHPCIREMSEAEVLDVLQNSDFPGNFFEGCATDR
jgi:hypothetical protein